MVDFVHLSNQWTEASLVPKQKQAPGEEGDDCVICDDRKRTNIALVPCGHAAYCGICVELIKKCSICNAEIQARMKVYHKN